MNKCLVTKLNGTVNNDSIIRIGEARVVFTKTDAPSKLSQGLTLVTTKDVKLEIVGDGYFTDENLTENKGKTMTANTGSTTLYVSNSNVELAILDKYNIKGVRVPVSNKQLGCQVDIDFFKYSSNMTALYLNNSNSKGDLSSLENLPLLVEVNLANTQVTGDIANLKNMSALKFLYLNNIKSKGDLSSLKALTTLTTLDLSKTNISGNISSLTALTNLTLLNLSDTQVIGDISTLKTLTALNLLKIGNKDIPITGDIGRLSSLNSLSEITIQYGSLSGDVATLPANFRRLSLSFDKASRLTWSTRPSSSKIIAFSDITSIDNVDKMLQDQAQCQVGFLSSDSIYYKTIAIRGTRTSASDAAVQALQQKGYTVSITPA